MGEGNSFCCNKTVLFDLAVTVLFIRKERKAYSESSLA